MNATISYLEQLKTAYPLDGEPATDYRAAKLLNVRPTLIYAYRAGRSKMGDKTALKLAQLLDIPANVVVANLHLDKAETEDEKAFWRSMKVAELPHIKTEARQ